MSEEYVDGEEVTLAMWLKLIGKTDEETTEALELFRDFKKNELPSLLDNKKVGDE